MTKRTGRRYVGALLRVTTQPSDTRVVFNGTKRRTILVDAAAPTCVVKAVLLFRAFEDDVLAARGIPFEIVNARMFRVGTELVVPGVTFSTPDVRGWFLRPGILVRTSRKRPGQDDRDNSVCHMSGDIYHP